MKEKLEELKAMEAELFDLSYALGLMGWDQQVNMPPGGAEARGRAMAALGQLVQEKSISPENGKLLEELRELGKDLDPDSDEARLIKVASKDYEKNTKVPPEMVAELAVIQNAASMAWREAREKSDFSIFEPHLEKVVDYNQRFAELYAPYDHVYDPLLDIFEPGMKTAEVKAIFEDLRPKQVALIKAISEKPQVDDSFLHQPFDEKKQWDFGEAVITDFGYDWNRGRQDKAPHPFTSGIALNDVRITTRVSPDFLNPALFATMHEAGHALHGMGGNPEYERTSLSGIASLAIGESQSRMFENLVGRSLDFWTHYYPKLQDVFPSQLGNVDLDTFYKGINMVKPSMIRVEADEATYNMHIMLRLEIEIGMMEGSMPVKDLPEIWNSRMEDYLGVTPANDAEGVLQDVHWSFGAIGYFSTYALGNLVSAQLWEKINEAIPDLGEQIRSGQFESLLGWLGENVHILSRKFEPQEVVERITGSKINADPYMRYLESKLGAIYGL